MTPESNSPPPNHVSNRNHLRLLLKHFLLSLALLSLSFGLLLAWLISTESGLRLLVTQAQRWAPGDLKIQSYQGRLIEQFSVTGLSYQYQDFSLQIASLQLAWEATALWHTKVHLTQWQVNQMEIHLPKSPETKPEKSTSIELPSHQLPVQIALDDIQIHHLTIHRPDADPIQIDHLELRSTTTDILELHQVQVKSPLVNATLTGTVGLQTPHAVQLHLKWSAPLPLQALTVTGEAEVKGDMQTLQVTSTISQPLTVQLNSTFQDILKNLRFDTKLTWQELYWPITGEHPIVNSQQGQFTLTGSLDNYHIDLQTNLSGQQIPKGFWQIRTQGNLHELTLEKLHAELLQGVIEATGKVSFQPQLAAQLQLNTHDVNLQEVWNEWPERLQIDSQVVATLEGENFQINQLQVNLPPTMTQMSLQGEGLLKDQQPQLKLAKLNWQNLQWPLLGTSPLASSTAGRLHFSGNLEDYRFDLDTQLAGAQIPAGQWNIMGQGNLQQMAVEKLHTEILNGVIQGKGAVHWQPTLSAQLNLHTSQITLEQVWKDWPAKLELNSQLVAKLDGDRFTIDPFELTLPPSSATLSLRGEGSLADTHNPSFHTMLTWKAVQWPLVGATALVQSPQGRVNLTGTLQDYQIDLETNLSSPQVPQSHLRLTGGGNLQQFIVNSLRTDLLQGVVNATGQVHWQPAVAAQLSVEAKQLNLTEVWKDWPANVTLNSQLTANWQDTQVKIPRWIIELPETQTLLNLQAEASLAGNQPRFQTALTWQKFQWPLASADPKQTLVNSPHGKLSVTGTLSAYQLQLDTQLHGANLPSGHWQAVGQGDSEGLLLKKLQGDVLQGQLNLTGRVNWKPTVTWELALQGNGLNPGKQWSEWPGQLALDIQTQGQLTQGVLETQLEVKKLQGKLRNYSLQLQTLLGVKGTQYDLKKLQFQVGPSRLTAHGQLGSQSQLQWELKVPDFATLWPAAKGSLAGYGKLSGPLALPNVTVHLDGKGLAVADKQMQSLQADVALNWKTGLSSNLVMLATGIKQGNMSVERVQLQGQGEVTKHSLQMDVLQSPKNQMFLKLEGSLKSPQWQGTLQHLTVTVAKLESAWRLQAPVTLKVSPTEAELSPLCLKNTQSARWCTQLHWQPNDTSTVRTTVENFSLNLLRAFLPPESQLDLTGLLKGTVTASLRPDGVLTSDTTLSLSPGILKTVVDEELREFPHQGGNVTAQVNQDGLTANINLKFLKNSSIMGNVRIPQLTRLPLDTRHHLQGQLQMTFDDFNLLPSVVSQVEKTQGKVNLAVTLGGTLAAPMVRGQLRVQDVAADLPDAGLQLKNGSVTIQDRGRDTFQIQAKVNSGGGQLTLQGEAKLLSFTQWSIHLTLSGKEVEVVNLPLVLAQVSPQLEIHLSPNGILVTGQVTLPTVVITPPQTTSGVIPVSKDVVIVGPNSTPAELPKSQTLPISSDVTVILGQNVTFTGAGFNSHITGSLRIRGQPDKVPIGQGELLIDGIYKAYGQALKVEKGRVIFSSGPVDNPGLDIRAFRRIYQRGYRDATSGSVKSDEEVIAGVHIHGMAKSPQVTLYSRPALDQSNTLSYIVLGKPIAKASGEEGKALLGATIASQLPGAGGESLPQKIGKQVGLDEATISSEKGIAEATLVMGKYLSPELYISYGVGLFDASTVLRIRYQLSQRLTLETETGKQSGVDLRYSLER